MQVGVDDAALLSRDILGNGVRGVLVALFVPPQGCQSFGKPGGWSIIRDTLDKFVIGHNNS